MHRRKSAREHRRKKAEAASESEANEEDEATINYENESDSNIRYSSTPAKKSRTISGSARLKGMRNIANEDSEESTDARPKERSMRRQRSSKSLRNEDEIHEEGSFRDENMRKKRRRSKRRRSSDILEKTDAEDTVQALRASRSRMRGGGDDDARPRRKKNRLQAQGTIELPITEILKKAQQSTQKRYEEPIPLTELSTDTLYVQGKKGFNAVKIGRDSQTPSKKRPGERVTQPIHVAIVAQGVWKSATIICQGLFGGVALMHVIVILMFFGLSLEFILAYSTYSEIYTCIFSFFVVVSFLAAMDKFDIAHLDVEHLREICASHVLTAVTIPLYLTIFCLHLSTLRIDDKLALANYNHSAWEDNESSNETAMFFKELNRWRDLTVCKDILAVITWLFVAVGSRGDLLLVHLEAMEKYADQDDFMK